MRCTRKPPIRLFVPGADRLPGLREDVVREVVVRDLSSVGDIERAVAFRAPDLDGLDADALRRHTDPRVARSHQMVVGLEPVDVEIVSRRHVVPSRRRLFR
mgnify:CR=1 FL=1